MKKNEFSRSCTDDSSKKEISRDRDRATIALSTSETVSRFGGANAEFIKGYRGFDNETGQKLAKGLADIAKHKVNSDPRYAEQNIKQQAGIAAEVATTSRDNAEAIINGSDVRTHRTDDLPQYGKNHNIVDRVQISNGQIIDGTESQMKFVADHDRLIEEIVKEEGQFTRYRGRKLDLPTEQYEGNRELYLQQAERLKKRAEDLAARGKSQEAEKALRHAEELKKFANSKDFQPTPAAELCLEKAALRRQAAEKAEAAGKLDEAQKLRKEAEECEKLAKNIRDSGLSSKDAVFYRKHPRLATALDIVRTSHRAGLEGAKYGAAIGSCISLLKNFLAIAQDEKEPDEAVKDVAIDTAKAAMVGYGTAAAGAAIKGSMQQSGSESVRRLAGTNLPALAVNVCISLGSSVKRYVTGEISEAQLLTEVGEKGSGILSSSMMAALGQIALPVPVVGAAVGGMIGYTLSSIFYQSALDAARGVELSRQQLERIRAVEAAARDRIREERGVLEAFVAQEIPQLRAETERLINAINFGSNTSVDEVAAAINHYATLLGKELPIQSMQEFDSLMKSNDPLML